MLTLPDVDLANKRVLIRSDLNISLQQNRITSEFRLKSSLPTIHSALESGAKVIVVSHLGRPEEGSNSLEQPEFSMLPVANWIEGKLNSKVRLIEDWEEGIDQQPSSLVLLENIRFKLGETSDSTQLASKLASLCDVFIMDAFACSHRKHASTHGVIKQAPVACAGLLMTGELAALENVRNRTNRPLTAVIGGAKISTKMETLKQLIGHVDQFLIGGGIANTLLLAAGHRIGQSFHELRSLEIAKKMLSSGQFMLPRDAVILRNEEQKPRIVAIETIEDEDRILDIGPATRSEYAKQIQQTGSIIWNGPMGVFEKPGFASGTKAIADAISTSKAFSVAGGGDTLASLEAFGGWDGISLISTGGGAFLEFMEGKNLPSVAALDACA